MKKLFAIMLATMAFAACANDDNFDLDYFTEHYGTDETDTDSTEVNPTLPDTLYVSIAYNGNSASLTGDVDQLTISRTDAHVVITSTTDRYLQLSLSGTSTDGSLLVYSQKKYGMVLNGLSLTNPIGPAINNQCGKSLYVACADGTENTLTDGTDYATQSFDQKGVLFSEGQIYLRGSGKLTVNGNSRNGIASDDYIVMESGTVAVNVSASGTNGIKVNDGFTISGGTLSVSVKADGARGIKNDARTTISGGTTTINTSGDCLIETVDGVTDTTSAAGIKCDSLFTMTGGALTITSSGDGGKGINCDQNVELSGGTLTVTTTGDNDEGKPKGIKSATAIIVSGGSLSVNVKKSWALDNGNDSEDPSDRITVNGTPATCSLAKRSVTVKY